MAKKEHSIDVTFHRLQEVIFYQVIIPAVTPDEQGIRIHQKWIGSIYTTFDKRVKENRVLLQLYNTKLGSLGAETIPDMENQDLIKKILSLWDDGSQFQKEPVDPMQVAIVPARRDLPEQKRYRLFSEQMARGFAYAVGSSGLAMKYAGGPAGPGDTKAVDTTGQDFQEEEPRNFQPVLRLKDISPSE